MKQKPCERKVDSSLKDFFKKNYEIAIDYLEIVLLDWSPWFDEDWD